MTSTKELCARGSRFSFDRIACIQNHKRGAFAGGKAIPFKAQNLRILVCDHVKAAGHFFGAGHLRHVQAHKGDIQHVGGAQ